MKIALALLALASFAPGAQAGQPLPTKLKLLCIVNTYDFNGDDFKSLTAAYHEIEANKVTEFFRSESTIYSAYFTKDELAPGKPQSTLSVEMKKKRNGRQVSAAAAQWPTGASGTHQVTAYSTEAEKGLKTMAGCLLEPEKNAK
ncbi:MAG: hypothetical protein EOP11_16490 [Proteobacteria bacterium]|nr:MAG: hypothetical protein EOP11_16490 [Pseudomonadota bacterium]